MRQLVACGECKRQFDASGREPGSRFHCSCGRVITVPVPRAQDAAVIRCSACGGPRERGAASCTYCDSDFALAEQNRHTLCPECMTLVSDQARFCHQCATRILPQGTAGEATPHGCPGCGSDQRLVSRALGQDELLVLECGRCAGMWLGSEVFRQLEQRQREQATGSLPIGRPPAAAAVGAQKGPLYRRCPMCSGHMARRNYAKKSGVVVDVCREDGIWFDEGELDRVLAWIREGGLAHAAQAEAEERARLTRTAQAQPLAGFEPTPWDGQDRSRGLLGGFVGALIGGMFRY